MAIDDVLAAHGGLATARQLLEVASHRTIARRLRAGTIFRVSHGVYSSTPPDTSVRLAALDLLSRTEIVACLHTAAELFGFDTDHDHRLHILDPGVRLRSTPELSVHQRVGAPLCRVGGRLATTPAWTAIEIGRTVRRGRILGVLDAVLRSQRCTALQLANTVVEQHGRRGIVAVRSLLPLADPRSESPMESEARLVFHDGGLPSPELQYEIVDRYGKLWRVDFAWPQAMLVAEYESMEWHANPAALRHDRMKVARLQECGWTSLPIVIDDVRRYPDQLVNRIFGHLERPRRAS
ncbi:type IV toxin-antitoxin system AbiEi family antitoxin domain-containing protein [Mycobacterium sp. AMU20-3851]|uniref:type IV toxin-antitoxin system AbiEi family antitoxin domain-containing protein n=1 Tax=Mycobacterium sp. AMU20-3851 TaxID=3122055 RepID=UPI003753E9A1